MFKYQGVGAEEYGPPKPTITQQVTQAAVDVERSIEQATGLKNFAMYAGGLLIGYVAYSYYNHE